MISGHLNENCFVRQLWPHFPGQRLVRDPASERCSDIGSLSKGSVQVQCQIFQWGEEAELGQAYGPWTCSQLHSQWKRENICIYPVPYPAQSSHVPTSDSWPNYSQRRISTPFSWANSVYQSSRNLFYASCIFCWINGYSCFLEDLLSARGR